MKIRLMWVGKTKERFIDEGIRKYTALLKPYADVSIAEIKEEKGKDIQKVREKEGKRIMKSGTPYVLLDEKGQCLTSVQFADFLRRRPGDITFLLGGPYGVSEEVKGAAKETIALSKMTLTHEMSRLLLLEQLFRACTIIHKRGYHH
jgi:23S rRNA (pseudouridine1915-N3)-methyltransferase